MSNSKLFFLLLFTAPWVTMAASGDDLKFGGFIGITGTKDNSITDSSATTLNGAPATFGYDIETDTKTGYILGGSVSYWLDSGVIFEGELNYQHSEPVIDGTISFSNDSQTDSLVTVGVSKTQALSAMANVWYEFGSTSDRAIRPFLGGGLGAANVEVDGAFSSSGTALGSTINNTTRFSGSNTQFAWQAGGGLNYHLDNGAVWSLGYRYMDLGELGTNVSSNLSTHAVTVGFRF